MSHEPEISYLDSIKTANSAAIANNEATIDAFTSAIASLNDQIANYQSQIATINTTNSQLVADNEIIDDIIVLLQ